MTEKELRKLNRYQLLDLLIVQTERADKLHKQVAELENKLLERDLHMTKLGSIAEASIQLSGVFEASQKAADSYLDAAKKQADEIVSNAREQAALIVARAEAQARCMSGIQQEDHNETTGKRNAT